jgi:hypothetical protein
MIKFYNGRRLVYKVAAITTASAISLMESTGIEWTRYKWVK